jgi:hypothetical protein
MSCSTELSCVHIWSLRSKPKDLLIVWRIRLANHEARIVSISHIHTSLSSATSVDRRLSPKAAATFTLVSSVIVKSKRTWNGSRPCADAFPALGAGANERRSIGHGIFLDTKTRFAYEHRCPGIWVVFDEAQILLSGWLAQVKMPLCCKPSTMYTARYM